MRRYGYTDVTLRFVSLGPVFEEFRDRVRVDAGRDAEACGEVAIGQSRLQASTCLADAFGNGTDAYAVFRARSDDSVVAAATIVRDGDVTFYSFDSDPTGGNSSDNGRISVRSCLEPMLSGTVDDATVFLCAERPSSGPMGGGGDEDTGVDAFGGSGLTFDDFRDRLTSDSGAAS